MKKLILKIFVSLFIFTNVSYSQESLPVVKIDEEHWAVQKKDGSASVYKIPEGDGFVLEVNSYAFKIPPSLNDKGVREPSFISICIGENQCYGIVWSSSKNRYLVSKETLQPFAGSPAFSGFKKGQKVTIEIGCFFGEHDESSAPFYPFWYSTVDII